LELALVAAAVMALLIGIPMGVYAALRRGTFLSQLFMMVSLLGVSLAHVPHRHSAHSWCLPFSLGWLPVFWSR
jgi:peptide/nickel transport system permease protein